MNIARAHDCAKLPGATRDLKWAFEDSVHPVFSVGAKMFARFTLAHDKLVDQLMFKEAHHVVMAKLSKKMPQSIRDGWR